MTGSLPPPNFRTPCKRSDTLLPIWLNATKGQSSDVPVWVVAPGAVCLIWRRTGLVYKAQPLTCAGQMPVAASGDQQRLL